MPSGLAATVDEELIAKYRDFAAPGKNFLGLTVEQYERDIAKLINRTHARDLFDYGSGHGQAWPVLAKKLGVTITCYDPAIPKYEHKPSRMFDGVICVDVMEHIPERMVRAVLEDLFSFATRFVFITTCSRLAKKLFPDGSNPHCTIRPYHWWWEQISEVKALQPYPLMVLHRDSP